MKLPYFYSKTVIISCFALITKLYAQRDDGIRIRFNGFGDVTAGATMGTPTNSLQAAQFSSFGEDPYPKGTHRGLGLQGLDLVNTVFINDNLTVQSEVNLQVPRGNTGGPELDVERLYMDYKVSDKLGFQGGLMFTPIGFVNRNWYSRAWLMNSVHMFRLVEEEAGYVPNHFIGGTSYGVFSLTDGLSLKYIVGLGNARGYSPVSNFYARNFSGYQVTGLLELIVQGPKDLRIGLSGYTNDVPTYRGLNNFGDAIIAGDSLRVNIQESGFNPYIHYYGKLFEFTGEYHMVHYGTPAGMQNNTFTHGLILELAVNTKVLDRRLAPYVRYDYIQTPANNGPYLGIRENGDGTLRKIYEPDLKTLMLGICYDLFSFNRIKIEYAYYFDGPYQPHGIVFQTAFGF
ncbi:MAG: hypothetical protein NW207_06280 [Cytophagales bacterium]|nr:hypothetical protein [Cytophagales bacterium]